VRRAPGIALVRMHYADCIRRAQERGETRLPSVSEVSRTTGVCLRTACAALKSLRDEGAVKTIRGHGVFVHDHQPVANGREDRTEPAQSSKSSTLTRTLSQDILSGGLSSRDRLPRLKEMAHQYGVTYRTLRKSLQSLVGSGLLKPDRSRFAIRRPRPSQQQFGAGVVLILPGDRNGVPDQAIPRTVDNLRSFDQECFSSGLSNEVLCWNNADGRLYSHAHGRVSVASAGKDNAVLGYVIWNVGMRGDGVPVLLDACTRTGKRVVLFDEAGTPPAASSRRLLHLRSAFDERPGSDVGSWLLRRGHRHVAYISPLHDARWSQLRCRGLVQSYERAGMADGIAVFAAKNFERMYGTEDLYAKRIRECDAMLAGIAAQSPREELGGVLRHMRSDLSVDVYDQMVEEMSRPLFDKALEQDQIRCWVCGNDPIALAAMEYLRRALGSEQRRISVVGFDDGASALRQGLTSYNFNGAGAFRVMVRFIVSSDSSAASGFGKGPVEIPGYVVERRSAWPVA
jgi:DNA-binding transcriptional regulator YhcF (GntR family)/DNA-binding LacI/PurR family transcriptional regulator